ncbi:MAG: adenosylcobinamide-GDP ribazoletransferase, partial [Acidimicrobiia bacterium]
GGERSTILEVMKDSRVGVYGVAALVLAIGLKASLLTTLPDGRFVLVATVAAAVSRACAVTMMKLFPPAKNTGLVADLSPSLSSPLALITALLGVGAAALLGWPQAISALVGWVAGFLVGWWAWRRIGGLTGDVVGAMVVVSELGVLTLA